MIFYSDGFIYVMSETKKSEMAKKKERSKEERSGKERSRKERSRKERTRKERSRERPVVKRSPRDVEVWISVEDLRR